VNFTDISFLLGNSYMFLAPYKRNMMEKIQIEQAKIASDI
jgi:hypothetical protein